MPPPLNASDHAFVERRRIGARARWMFPLLLLLLMALAWVAMFAWTPMLVSPMHVLGLMEKKAIADGTLTLYAVAATLLANAVLLSVCTIALVLLSAASQERRYLRIVERLTAQDAATTSNDTGA